VTHLAADFEDVSDTDGARLARSAKAALKSSPM
jgi:hypothetical protein